MLPNPSVTAARRRGARAPAICAKAPQELPPNIFLGSRCNHDCVFCSEGLQDKTQPPDVIRRVIAAKSDTLSIEGGEPTLSKDLETWVKLARKTGVRDIILCTNGVRFGDEAYVRRLCDAGITLFNVNFPAHQEKTFDAATGTQGQFAKRLAAYRALIDVAGGRRVRFNMVVHRLNYLLIPQYVRFVRARFPEIFYIEFNLVKVLGYVERRPYLVPRLADVMPGLLEAMRFMMRARMKFIVDGFPLCVMDGFEWAAIDPLKLYRGDSLYLDEKKKSPKCADCTHGSLCAGPREDYLALYGDGELRTMTKDSDVTRAIVVKLARERTARAGSGG